MRSRTAPGRAKGLEENGAGPSGGGGGERGIFKHRGQSQARWAFRAWGSGGDGIYRAHTQRAVRERGRRICPPGNDLKLFLQHNDNVREYYNSYTHTYISQLVHRSDIEIERH